MHFLILLISVWLMYDALNCLEWYYVSVIVISCLYFNDLIRHPWVTSWLVRSAPLRNFFHDLFFHNRLITVKHKSWVLLHDEMNRKDMMAKIGRFLVKDQKYEFPFLFFQFAWQNEIHFLSDWNKKWSRCERLAVYIHCIFSKFEYEAWARVTRQNEKISRSSCTSLFYSAKNHI